MIYNYFYSYYENSREEFNGDSNLLSEDALKSYIYIESHRIEKGLTFNEVKPLFGKDVIIRLLSFLNSYKTRFSDLSLIEMAESALLAYIEYHKLIEVDTKHLFSGYNFSIEKSNKSGVSFYLKEDPDSINMFTNRRSVRDFNSTPINFEVLENCLERSIKSVPTVCNRPIFDVIIVKDKDVIKRLLSLQNGNRGFGEKIPCLIIPSVNMKYFHKQVELNTPYVSSGMISMSILYSLYLEGFGTCCLNWNVQPQSDFKAKEILGIKSGVIPMFIAVGNYDEGVKVANSYREKPVIRVI